MLRTSNRIEDKHNLGKLQNTTPQQLGGGQDHNDQKEYQDHDDQEEHKTTMSD